MANSTTTTIIRRAPSSAGARVIRCGARQVALFDTLLPRLALDLSKPAPADLRALFAHRPDQVRLEIGFGGAEHLIAQAQANPAQRFHRQRRLRQRHRQGAGRDRRQRARQYPSAFRRRQRTARLAARRRAHAHRSALSRSMAETAALEAALHPGRQSQAAGAHSESRRRIALRHRHCRLRGLRAGARDAVAGFRLDRRARRRLAQAWPDFYRHAL